MDKKRAFKRVAEVAAMSPATKRKVGAILYKGDKEVGFGFNYNPAAPFCENAEGETLSTVVHAEVACLNNATVPVAELEQCVMYVSHQPCINCETALQTAGVRYEVVEEFLKFDGDKLRYDLVPPSAIEAMAAVLTFGARKYKPNNWKNCQEPERYLAATLRHLEAFRKGEEQDADSGFSHLAHALTNIAFMLELGYVPKDWK